MVGRVLGHVVIAQELRRAGSGAVFVDVCGRVTFIPNAAGYGEGKGVVHGVGCGDVLGAGQKAWCGAGRGGRRGRACQGLGWSWDCARGK